jgi:O-antigen/teichoic acid export membrane protein
LRYATVLSLGLAAVGLAAVAVLSLLPDAFGRELLAGTWPDAALVMPAVGVSVLAGMAATGARLGLRAMHATAQVLYLRLVSSLLALSLGVGGALAGGLVPAAWGLATAQAATAVTTWVLLRRLAAAR